MDERELFAAYGVDVEEAAVTERRPATDPTRVRYVATAVTYTGGVHRGRRQGLFDDHPGGAAAVPVLLEDDNASVRRGGHPVKPILSEYRTEAEFKRDVVRYARQSGWLVYHHPDSRHTSYDTGFPDLVMVPPAIVSGGYHGDGPVLFAECKNTEGRFSADQSVWFERLLASGAQVVLWRPEHHQSIMRTLERGMLTWE